MPPHPRHDERERAAEALGRVAPLASRWIERLLAGHDPPLTLAQYLVLGAVADGELVGSELARRAAVSPAAISQLLASLELAGLLERLRSPNDRRRQQLAPTTTGKKTLSSARRLLREQLRTLLADLPPHDTAALARLLETLEAPLTGTAPPPRPRRPPPHRPPHRDRPPR